ncbi:MAG: translation elongation factor EF-1 subunit alpha [Candidatus Aenigmatarchaeota archaeon]
MADKPHLNLVTIGHVDHGKSTLVGHLLYDTGNLPDKEYKKLEEAAEEAGKETFGFAFAMDSLKEERERGVTIDVAHTEFDTDNYHFTVIDAPGHRDFVKNMITGASQADAAILVVSAKDGVQDQTKEHSYLAKVLGVGEIIVAVNKMDTVDYSEDKFEEVKKETQDLLKSIGFKPGDIPFVPVSAFYGDNVAEPKDEMDWYDGPTIYELLDDLEEPTKPVNKSMRIPIQDVYTITGVGTVPVGKVETGQIKKGDKVLFLPSDVTGEVKSIEMHHEEVDEAQAGDNIGFNTRGISKEDIRRGDVACDPDDPVTVAKEFRAQIIVMEHPNVIAEGYTPVFHCNTAQVASKFVDLEKKVDSKTGETKEENPDYLKTGDSAVVKIRPTEPMAIEEQGEFPELSRFAIRDMGKTVAAGICIEVTEEA